METKHRSQRSHMSDERALFESWYFERYREMPNGADEDEFETFKSIRQWMRKQRPLGSRAAADKHGL